MTENKNVQKSHEPFWFLFLSGTYALIIFILFLSFQTTNVKSKNNDFNFYILGWALFVPLGLWLGTIVEKINAKYLRSFTSFGLIFAFFNFLFLLYQLYPATWDCRSKWIELSEFLALQCCIFFAIERLSLTDQKLSLFLERSLMLLMSCSFAVWSLSLSFEYFNDFSITNWLVVFLVVLILRMSLPHDEKKTFFLTRNRGSFWGIELYCYLIALFLIVILVTDPSFGFNRYHYAFFLGPLTDFQCGKSFLVNINSQYGVLLFYFLSLFFKILPLGFKSLSLVLTFLFVVQYFCFYFIVRQLFNSRFFSFTCLIILLMVNYFGQQNRMTEYPSVGPLRFGFIYFLLTLVVLRNQHFKYKKYFYIVESAVTAASVFWSFEVCVYTLPSYFGLLIYESVQRGDTLKIDVKTLIRRIAVLTIFCFLILGFIYEDVFRRTHQWPHWNYYFDYIFLYKDGFGMLPVPACGGWWIIVGILLVSLFAITGSLMKWKDTVLPSHFNAMALLTFYGIFQLFYFLGRAHTSNLFIVSMPSVLLAAFWLYCFQKTGIESSIPVIVKKSVLILSALGLGIFLQLIIPNMSLKLCQTLVQIPSLFSNAWNAVQDLPRNDDFAKTADFLMNKYSGSQKQLIYFFGDRDLDVALYTKRTNAFPYNDIGQVSICPAVVKRVVFYNPSISVGDYIYTSKDMDESFYDLSDGKAVLSPLEKIIFYRLSHGLNLKWITEQNGITVFQVVGDKKTLKLCLLMSS